jgi:hypothetical protein
VRGKLPDERQARADDRPTKKHFDAQTCNAGCVSKCGERSLGKISRNENVRECHGNCAESVFDFGDGALLGVDIDKAMMLEFAVRHNGIVIAQPLQHL